MRYNIEMAPARFWEYQYFQRFMQIFVFHCKFVITTTLQEMHSEEDRHVSEKTMHTIKEKDRRRQAHACDCI